MKLKAYFQEDDGLSRLWRRLLNILELDPIATSFSISSAFGRRAVGRLLVG